MYDHSLARLRNRRSINEDGTLPKCLVCGNVALKHDNRNKWKSTCGNKDCSIQLRISKMKLTKGSVQWKETVLPVANAKKSASLNETVNGVQKKFIYASVIRDKNMTVGSDGLTGYQRAARKAAPLVRLSNELSGNWTPVTKLTDKLRYERAVAKVTRTYDVSKLTNHEKRGQSGLEGAYHLDHKFSVHEGFRLGIPPEIIGHICNLQYVPWRENVSKNKKCSISLERLLYEVFQQEDVRSLTSKV